MDLISEPHLFRQKSFLVSLAFFTNLVCLDGDFIFDDSEAVVNNPDVSGDGKWIDILKDDFWGTPLNKNSTHGSFRPIVTFIFRVIWNTFHEAWYFRLLNLTLHCLVTLNLYKVLLLALDLQYDPFKKHRVTAALIASSLFAVHPIHTETLCSAVGLADVLCALFFIFGFKSYIEWTRNPKSLRLPADVVMYSALAMFSKEPGITLLGVCGAYELLLVCDIFPHHGITKYKTFINSFKKSSIFRFGFCALTGLVLLVARCAFVHFKAPVFQPMDNPASFLPSPILRAVNYQYVYALNMLLLVYPHWLCFDWSMGCIPSIISPFDVRLLSVAVFWIIVATLVRACSRDCASRRWYCLASSLLIIPFLPSSNIFVRVGFVIAERNLYICSAGFCLLLAIVFIETLKKLSYEKTLSSFSKFFFILLMLFILRTVRRSRDWSQETRLYKAGLTVCPLNAKVHYNIAKVSSNRTAAIESYQRAIELNPMYDQAMNNLANIYKDADLLHQAKSLFERAIEIRPTFAAAWMNLGIVEAALHNYEKAEKCYINAISIRNRYPHCYFNLGNLYLEIKSYTRALSAYRKAVTQSPDHLLSWNNMVILLDSIGRLEEAQKVATEGLRHLPEASSLYFHLGNTLGKLERFEQSEMNFQKAIRMKEDPVYHSNLGVLYHRWGRIELAQKEYIKALKLNPAMSSVIENLEKLERSQATKQR